jgi:hypothetical protein
VHTLCIARCMQHSMGSSVNIRLNRDDAVNLQFAVWLTVDSYVYREDVHLQEQTLTRTTQEALSTTRGGDAWEDWQ